MQSILNYDLSNSNSANNISAGEHLTESRLSILTSAVKLKKADKLNSVYSKDGIIKIRLKKGDKYHFIKSYEDFEEFKAKFKLA